MSEISERYARLSKKVADKIAAIADDTWDAPTTCEDWTVRDLVKHVAETPGMFYGFIGQEAPELPDEPAAAFDVTRQAMHAALEDPGTATTEFDGFFGRSTFEQAVDRFINFDLVIHGWDLARATGQDETIEDGDLARMEEAAKGFGDSARAPGVFGPEIEVPADADRQTKLLAFCGRRA